MAYNIDIFDAGYQKTHLLRNVAKYDMFEILANSFDEYENKRKHTETNTCNDNSSKEDIAQIHYKKTEIDERLKIVPFVVMAALIVFSIFISYKQVGESDVLKIINNALGYTFASFFIFILGGGFVLYYFSIPSRAIFELISTYIPGKNKTLNSCIFLFFAISLLSYIFGFVNIAATIIGILVGFILASIIAGFISKVIGERCGEKALLFLLPICICLAVYVAYTEGIFRSILLLLTR